MTKRQAHFQVFGYEPLRMKPAHFASGFFLALTGQAYVNELLNKVAVTKTNKGLLEGYTTEDVLAQLTTGDLIAQTMTHADVDLLRMQVNCVVNNDAAMYPAFHPYRPKGNDYTFISPRVLTNSNRTDGFAGFFVSTILAATDAGRIVLAFGRALVEEPSGTLEQFVEPLLADNDPEPHDLREMYEGQFGEPTLARIAAIADDMRAETDALGCLCVNIKGYSHYKKIRCYILGLLAWLMSYILKTVTFPSSATLWLFFDFVGVKDGPVRSQSQACYARLREIVRRSYTDFALHGRFDPDPIAAGLFRKKKRPDEDDFTFLEQHFGDLALRMGYAQPRASRVSQKHFELQPDTLRVLMLSILDGDAQSAITLDEVCALLRKTWNVVIGGLGTDFEALRDQGYFGFDEEDLRLNTMAFSERLKGLNMAFEPSDGLVLCSKDIGEIL